MEKHVIEIECPEGFIPKYNMDTGKIELVPVDIKSKVKTFEDAASIASKIGLRSNVESTTSLCKLQTILDVLNEGHKFDLVKDTVWYPYIKFYVKDKTPRNVKVIRDFHYRGKIYSLVDGGAPEGSYAGLSDFASGSGVGDSLSPICFFACKDKETASYVSTQFGQLIFESCFLRYFNEEDFRWL